MINDNMSDDNGASETTRRCTKCRHPMKNHPGPAGEHCQNLASHDAHRGPVEVYDDESEGAVGGATSGASSRTTGEKTGGTGGTTVAERMARDQDLSLPVSLLREMSRQMGDLAVSMAMIQKTLSANYTDAKNVDTASASTTSPNDNAIETSSGTPAHIGSKTVKAIRTGEYINLYELLPSDSTPTNEMVAIHNNDGSMTFQPKKTKKTIDNFDQWLGAWSIFEQILVTYMPKLYSKLTKYRQFIHTSDRKYQWYAVSIYDKRFRAKLAETKSFDYDVVDTTLYVSILDASAV